MSAAKKLKRMRLFPSEIMATRNHDEKAVCARRAHHAEDELSAAAEAARFQLCQHIAKHFWGEKIVSG